MSDSLFSKRYFYPVAGGIFCLVMACVPTILELAGLGGGGIAQLDMLNKIGIYAALALSLNLILGQTGLFHMGHTAFFAMGAYTTAILNTVYHWPVFATMPIAGVLAAIFAFVLAKPIIHLRGDYLLIVTIGIVEIVRIALTNNLFGLTGGANGIYGIARPSLFGMVFSSPKRQFYLIWTFTILTMFLFYVLEHSRFGRALNYIRYDDLAASGCGIDVTRYKLMAFTVGAFWAGMVGTLFAANIRTIEPTSFNFYESVILFAIVILGGSGSIAGAGLGTALPHPRRAGRGHERSGNGGSHAAHQGHPESGHHHPADRARHEPCHARLRKDRRAGKRGPHRRRHFRRDQEKPEGPRGLPRRGRLGAVDAAEGTSCFPGVCIF